MPFLPYLKKTSKSFVFNVTFITRKMSIPQNVE